MEQAAADVGPWMNEVPRRPCLGDFDDQFGEAAQLHWLKVVSGPVQGFSLLQRPTWQLYL